ncbi:MAG: aspartate carbamoyltransferase [Methanobacteriota archaeon]|nr:MAG: aspartate carbamoyltransferase [Euryarchaeota archaeon]
MKHLVSIRDISKEDILELIDLAAQIEASPSTYADRLKGKIMATLFYEPSTRTRLSFESAMLRLGGKVIGFSDAKVSSAKKGESIADTIRMAASYADVIVLRHFLEGSGRVAVEFSDVPVISGGTGIQEHPTQALLDVYTIYKHFGSLEDLTLGLVGDLRYGRTIPSLLYALSKFDNNKVFLLSPPELRPRMSVLNDVKGKLEAIIRQDLRSYIDEVDVLYMTRVQKERFPDEASYERVKDFYILTEDLARMMNQKSIIMHPLPRVNEISYEVDHLPQAKYFEQARNGVWMRMAILLKLIGENHE